MKYLLSLLICVPLFGQVTLSQEEMLGIANNIKELEHSDSMKTVQIGIYDELVKELESRIEIHGNEPAGAKGWNRVCAGAFERFYL